jgi:hypothetical protein
MMKESWKLLFPEHNHKNRKSNRSGDEDEEFTLHEDDAFHIFKNNKRKT